MSEKTKEALSPEQMVALVGLGQAGISGVHKLNQNPEGHEREFTPVSRGIQHGLGTLASYALPAAMTYGALRGGLGFRSLNFQGQSIIPSMAAGAAGLLGGAILPRMNVKMGASMNVQELAKLALTTKEAAPFGELGDLVQAERQRQGFTPMANPLYSPRQPGPSSALSDLGNLVQWKKNLSGAGPAAPSAPSPATAPTSAPASAPAPVAEINKRGPIHDSLRENVRKDLSSQSPPPPIDPIKQPQSSNVVRDIAATQGKATPPPAPPPAAPEGNWGERGSGKTPPPASSTSLSPRTQAALGIGLPALSSAYSAYQGDPNDKNSGGVLRGLAAGAGSAGLGALAYKYLGRNPYLTMGASMLGGRLGGSFGEGKTAQDLAKIAIGAPVTGAGLAERLQAAKPAYTPGAFLSDEARKAVMAQNLKSQQTVRSRLGQPMGPSSRMTPAQKAAAVRKLASMMMGHEKGMDDGLVNCKECKMKHEKGLHKKAHQLPWFMPNFGKKASQYPGYLNVDPAILAHHIKNTEGGYHTAVDLLQKGIHQNTIDQAFLMAGKPLGGSMPMGVSNLNKPVPAKITRVPLPVGSRGDGTTNFGEMPDTGPFTHPAMEGTSMNMAGMGSKGDMGPKKPSIKKPSVKDKKHESEDSKKDKKEMSEKKESKEESEKTAAEEGTFMSHFMNKWNKTNTSIGPKLELYRGAARMLEKTVDKD